MFVGSDSDLIYDQFMITGFLSQLQFQLLFQFQLFHKAHHDRSMADVWLDYGRNMLDLWLAYGQSDGANRVLW